MPLGFLIMIYRHQIKEFTGNIGFAEQYLGGTYNFMIMLGIAVFILSMMYAFGTIQDLFIGTFGVLFG